MKRALQATSCRSQSRRCVRIERVLAGLLVVGVILAVPGLAWSAGRSGPVAAETGPQSAAIMPAGETRPAAAEVTFESPSRFAIITELTSRRQRLYKAGDVVLEPNGSEWKILQIEQGRLRISDPRGRKASWVAEGSLLPGTVKRLVTGTHVRVRRVVALPTHASV